MKVITTRFKDAQGAPLYLGDTVEYTDELGRRYIGSIEIPIDFGTFMVKLTMHYSKERQRWESCLGGAVVYRVLSGCGKKALSKRLRQIYLISRKAERRSPWEKASA